MGSLYLAITDGTTTCTIADGAGGATSYRLTYGRWAPKIAGLRDSELGGRGPYEDVTEDLTLSVHGSSMADAYAKIHALSTLLEQAERFERGEAVAAVLIKYSPPDATISSAASPLQARVLGGAVTPPVNFNTSQPQFVIVGVKVVIARMGEWLHTTETQASAATNNGSVASIAMTGRDLIAPGAVRVSNIGQKEAANSYSDVMVIVAAANEVSVAAASTLLPATDYAGVADTGNFSWGGAVLRFTPTVTSERLCAGLALAPIGNLAVWASLRNNSATTTFRVRLKYTNGRMVSYTPPIVVPVSSGPKWYLLAIVANTIAGGLLQIGCTASAASGTLDIDAIAVANTDSPDYGCVAINQPCGYAGEIELIDPRALTAPQPYVGHNTSEMRSSYQGDAYLTSRAAAMRLLLLQTGSDGATIHWRATLGGAVIQNTWSLTRYAGYVTPR